MKGQGKDGAGGGYSLNFQKINKIERAVEYYGKGAQLC